MITNMIGETESGTFLDRWSALKDPQRVDRKRRRSFQLTLWLHINSMLLII